MEIEQATLRARRIRISLFFFFYGLTFATWASRIPNIQQRLHLTETGLGAVLLAMPIGSFLTVPFSGYFVAKTGSRKVVILSSFIYSLLLVGIGYSSSVWQLAICLFLFGSSGNMMNIGINTQAIALEVLYKKVIISSFHGMWSFAGLIAASIGTYLMGRAFPVHEHFLFISIITVVSFLLCIPYLLPDNNINKNEKRPFFVKPDKTFLSLGIIAFLLYDVPGRYV